MNRLDMVYLYFSIPQSLNSTVGGPLLNRSWKKSLHDIADVDVYINDIVCFSSDFQSPLTPNKAVLPRLLENGFTLNPHDCEWANQGTAFLKFSFYIDRSSIARRKLFLTYNRQEYSRRFEHFDDSAHVYYDMRPNHSHVLALFTDFGNRRF
jgi:hypothetical protein